MCKTCTVFMLIAFFYCVFLFCFSHDGIIIRNKGRLTEGQGIDAYCDYVGCNVLFCTAL